MEEVSQSIFSFSFHHFCPRVPRQERRFQKRIHSFPQYSSDAINPVSWDPKFAIAVADMPPKKIAPKKKDGNPENGGDLTQEMQSKMFMLTCQSLQLQLAERSEESSRALLAKRELQSRVDQITRDFEEEEKQTFEITQDMTRQYKGMQEELLGRVSFRNDFPLCVLRKLNVLI